MTRGSARRKPLISIGKEAALDMAQAVLSVMEARVGTLPSKRDAHAMLDLIEGAERIRIEKHWPAIRMRAGR